MIKRDDVINLEISGRDIARIYAIMGHVNGSSESTLWESCKVLLGDGSREKYDSLICGMTGKEILDYNSYRKCWEAALFSPVKTDAEKELDKLTQQLVELQAQIEVVKQSVKSN